MSIWKKTKLIWGISLSVTAVLLVLNTLSLWHVTNRFTPADTQVPNIESVEAVFKKWGSTKDHSTLNTVPRVPVGLFVQSLNFLNNNTVKVTGYAWQKLTNHLLKNTNHGLIFPEAVKGNVSESYRTFDRSTNLTTVGYKFEVELRQTFDFHEFPLDHKTIWIRMWYKDFSTKILLVPDFSSFLSTEPESIFGVDDAFVLQGFTFDETFFDYDLKSYDTSFGYSKNLSQDSVPELQFNIAIKRKSIDAFVINLFPLLVVLSMIFACLLTIRSKDDDKKLLGFNPVGTLRLAGGSFFVVMLAHIRLRTQFQGAGIVFLEHFYLLIYFIVIFVVLNAFTVTIQGKWKKKVWLFSFHDNLIPRLFFWPLLLLCTEILILYTFY